LEKHNKVVKITYTESEETPEEYITSEEFRENAKTKVKKNTTIMIFYSDRANDDLGKILLGVLNWE